VAAYTSGMSRLIDQMGWRGRLIARRVALLVAVAALVAGCGLSTDLAQQVAERSGPAVTDAEPPGQGGSGFEATARDFAAVRRVLRERAQAVTEGDRATFLSSVDSTDEEFYASQLTLFDNLQELPVAGLNYEVSDFGLQTADIESAGPTFAPETVEHVFLQGTDFRPVSNPVDYTFVRLDGRWLVAAESAARPDSTPHRPWAGGPIEVSVEGRLIAIADAGADAAADEISARAMTALQVSSDTLDVPVDSRLVVDATSNGESYAINSDELEAAAVTFPVFASRDFRRTRLAGWRVKINPELVEQLVEDDSLLLHEITHYVLREYSSSAPLWLTEGVPEYVSHVPSGFDYLTLSDDQYAELMAAPRELPLAGLFYIEPDVNYLIGHATAMYVVEEYGTQTLIELMDAFAASPYQPYGEADTAKLVRQELGISSVELAQRAFELLEGIDH